MLVGCERRSSGGWPGVVGAGNKCAGKEAVDSIDVSGWHRAFSWVSDTLGHRFAIFVFCCRNARNLNAT